MMYNTVHKHEVLSGHSSLISTETLAIKNCQEFLKLSFSLLWAEFDIAGHTLTITFEYFPTPFGKIENFALRPDCKLGL